MPTFLEEQRTGENANPEQMLTRQKKIEACLEDMRQSEEVIAQMLQIYSEHKKVLRGYLARNLRQAINDSKKSAGMDAFDLWAGAQSEDLAKIYEEYTYLETKIDLHSKILASKDRRLSGHQSLTKLEDWRG